MIGGMLIGAGLITLTIPLGMAVGKYLSNLSNSYPPSEEDDYLKYLSRKHGETNYTTDSRED